jgi:hypothetical protein
VLIVLIFVAWEFLLRVGPGEHEVAWAGGLRGVSGGTLEFREA